MAKHTLDSLIAAEKRHHKRELKELLLFLTSDLEGIDDDIYAPNKAIESKLLNVSRTGNRLSALLYAKALIELGSADG